MALAEMQKLYYNPESGLKKLMIEPVWVKLIDYAEQFG